MFKELAPLLRQRSVFMTLSRLEDDTIRVNVVPKKLNDSENNALTTPVSITGTAEELDAQLPSTLSHFVGAHLELKNTLETAKEQMTAAAKQAKSEARSKPQSKSEPARVETNKPASEVQKPAEPKKPEPPRTASLFDMSAVPHLFNRLRPHQEPRPAGRTKTAKRRTRFCPRSQTMSATTRVSTKRHEPPPVRNPYGSSPGISRSQPFPGPNPSRRRWGNRGACLTLPPRARQKSDRETYRILCRILQHGRPAYCGNTVLLRQPRLSPSGQPAILLKSSISDGGLNP